MVIFLTLALIFNHSRNTSNIVAESNEKVQLSTYKIYGDKSITLRKLPSQTTLMGEKIISKNQNL